MITPTHCEAAVDIVIETHLLNRGYKPVRREEFERKRGMFPEIVLKFVRSTQFKESSKLVKGSHELNPVPMVLYAVNCFAGIQVKFKLGVTP